MISGDWRWHPQGKRFEYAMAPSDATRLRRISLDVDAGGVILKVLRGRRPVPLLRKPRNDYPGFRVYATLRARSRFLSQALAPLGLSRNDRAAIFVKFTRPRPTWRRWRGALSPTSRCRWRRWESFEGLASRYRGASRTYRRRGFVARRRRRPWDRPSGR
jgi:hypothetical protein